MILTNEVLEKYIYLNTFDRQMNYKVQTILEGYTEILVETDLARHANRRKDVHGGALIAMSDTCMATACFSLGKSVSTLDLNGNYLRPVTAGERLLIQSQVEHQGRRTMVVTTKFYNSLGKQVYSGRATYFILGELDLSIIGTM